MDTSMNFDVGLINSVFIQVRSPHACKRVFDSNVPKCHSNCAEGLHFNAF